MQLDRAPQGEQEALSKLSEAEFHSRILLEERRNHLLSEAKFEVLLQERRAERADSSRSALNAQKMSRRSKNSSVRDTNKSHLLRNYNAEKEHIEKLVYTPSQEMEYAELGNGGISLRRLARKSECCNSTNSSNTGVARQGKFHG